MSFIRRSTFTLLALTLVGGVLAQAQAPITQASAQVNLATGVPESWPDPAKLKFNAVTFKSPKPQRTVLSNGLVVYLLEDHTLPLVNGAAFVKTGSFYDPKAKISLAGLTADLMRSGGSAGRSADEIDNRLETLAASVEVSADNLYTTASFSALTENVTEVLDIFAGVLEKPTFAPDRIELAKGNALEGIRRQNDDPVQIAVREFSKRLAQGSPAGYVPTAETVNAVSRADMLAFHKRYFKPNETVLAVSGDFKRKEMVAALEQALGSWQRGPVNYPKLPRYNPDPAPKIYHAQKDVGQSIIIMGHPSVYAYTPAYNQLDVANAVLGGGGFSSRLFTEVRTKRGLAYSVGSQISQGFVYPGTFLVFSFTRTDATGQVIALLKQQMKEMAAKPVSAAELAVQKSNILNGAVFRFTSPDAIVQRTARAVEILGLPADYFDRYIKDVRAMTPAKVEAVARKDFRPQDMLLMVVGDAAQFDRPLSDFGKVEEIKLALPTP